MAVRSITTRLALDGETQFKQAMTSINGALRNLKSEIALSEAQFKGQANTVAALTAKNKLLSEQIDQQKEKIKTLNDIVKRSTEIYGEESNITDRYRQQLNRAKAELIGLDRELVENSKYLKEARDSADGTARSIDGFGNATKQAGDSVSTLASALQAAGVAMALKEIADAIHACVDASMDFETAMANVNKVAKLSETELAGMGDAIKELSTEMPATTGEIAQVVEAAARLGIAKEDLLSFSEVMVNLGNVSDLTSDQAATALARFANITGTAAEDYSRLGSTIVALGNNFATNESELTEMASRLAAAGELAGLTEAQIMGLSAAMSSVGIEAEAGGTAMTQTLTAMEKAVTSGGDKLEGFALVARMSAQQFSDAWKNDPITAIQAFIAGLGSLDEQGESATQVLEELGLSGIRQSNMLKSLALASDTLTSAVSTANQAWISNTELADTAAAKYDTTEAKMQMAANAANNLKIAVGDQLTPALGVLADAGTGAFSWAADFVEECPILVSAITGVAAAGGVLATGFTVYAAKAALAAIATTGFGTALMATPIGPIAAGIGLLVGAFTALTAAIDDTKSEAEAYLDSLEEIKNRLADNAKAAEGSAEGLRAQADALLLLAEAGDLNAAQQQALLNMTQELNAAVPGLNLAYDEQTGKLNMTADAVRNLIEAEAQRMVADEGAKAYSELLVQQMEIARQLKDAEADLAQVRAESAAAMEKEAATGQVAIGVRNELEQKERELIQTVEELQEVYDEYQNGLDDVLDKYGDVASASNDTAGATEDMSNRIQQAGDTAQEAVVSIAELEEATLYLSGAEDTLSKALKEQSEEGSLSYKTTQDLIDAGYGAALAIDEETGAVTLNRAEYINLTDAKINDQIAALETQKQAQITAARLEAEAISAQHAGSAYWEMAAARLYAEKTDTTAIDAQIAAMNRLRSTLGNVTGETTRAARASRSAGKQAKTQAQQDLETYKQLKAELDHLKATDLVDEAEYYRKMAEYRDAYLTDDANVSEYRKVTEQIYKYDKSLADREAQLWADQMNNLVDQLEERIDAVSDQQDKMESRLSGYGDLFNTEDDRLTLSSLQDQISAIEAYGDALDQLRNRGISGGLMDEVMGMDVDSATQYARQLLAMSDQQWEEYNALWEEKQETAARIAEEFFKEQMDALENEYNAKLGDALGNLTDTSFQAGVNTGQELIDGLASMETALYAQAQAMADRVSDILSGAGRIPSNSELAALFSTDRIREQFYGVTPQQMQDVGVGMVNAMNTTGGGSPRSVTLKVNLNSRTIAEETIDDIRTVGRERPETLDDK